MKVSKDTYTLRGQSVSGVMDKIILFDGKFDTGWRVVSFDIAPTSPVSTIEVQGKLLSGRQGSFTGDTWDWRNQKEIAWAVWGAPSTNQINYTQFVDPDNVIIEDVFIQVYSGSGGSYNYQITLEKLSMNEWEGALAMVRNRLQANP